MEPTKYSDIIDLLPQKQAYNIKSEEDGAWREFIANDKFNGLLRKVVTSVRGNDISTHRSFWIDGTYGSGKSHAAAVITHLLCDTAEEAMAYADAEYADHASGVLREDLRQLRTQKRLLAVKLYGMSAIAHDGDLSLQVQQAVKEALTQAGLHIVVHTDFDNYVDSIANQPELWQAIMRGSESLRSVAPDLELLRAKLQACDMDTLARVRQAEAEVGMHVGLKLARLEQWLLDIQQKLREQSGYCGLFIVWDEFTEVMRSPVGLRVLTPLQEITETFMRAENDSYFLFITHPSAFDKLENAQEASKTKERYHYVHYNMAPVSAFRIMSHKFRVRPDYKDVYKARLDDFFGQAGTSDLLTSLTCDSQNVGATAADLRHIFPIHPMTANLATYYATVVGSSTRSVFDFMCCPLMRQFLGDERQYDDRATVTADILWDYVREELEADTRHFAPVTERWNTYHLHAEKAGQATLAVFKGLLLLNALNNMGGGKNGTTPSEQNIARLFVGTPIAPEVTKALEYISANSIVQRSPLGVYSVQFSALPAAEIAQKKAELATTQFRFTAQIAKYGDIIQTLGSVLTESTFRPTRVDIYSQSANDTTLLSSIVSGLQKANGYEIFIAFMVGATQQEVDHLQQVAKQATADERTAHVVFVVCTEPMGERERDNFIEYLAAHAVAQSHSLPDQMKADADSAIQILANWGSRICHHSVHIYGKGKQFFTRSTKIGYIINSEIAPLLFHAGPEGLKLIRDESKNTSWKYMRAKKIAGTILTLPTKDDIVAACDSQAQHVRFLLQDSVDNQLQWKDDIDPHHPLLVIYQRVKNTFDHMNRSVPFNLGEQLAYLTRAPYGLYPSFAGFAIVAFALRAYGKPYYDTSGRPRTPAQMVDDVVSIFKYWENGTPAQNLIVQFESRESTDICRQLKAIFRLDTLRGYTDVSSLKDARWAITHEYCRQRQAPLWVLRYALPAGAPLAPIVDDLVQVCTELDAARKPALLRAALEGCKRARAELRDLIAADDTFRRGLLTFMGTIESANVRDDEYDEAMEWLTHNMEGEIGLWREDVVRERLKDWRIAKLTNEATAGDTPCDATAPLTDDTQAGSHTITHEHGIEGYRQRARHMVQRMNRNKLYNIIEHIISNADTALLNIICGYADR